MDLYEDPDTKCARAMFAEPVEHHGTSKEAAWPGTKPSGAGARPPCRGGSPLEMMLRMVDAGPRPFYRAAIVALGVTSVLATAIASSVRPAGRLPWQQREMIVVFLATSCLSVVLGLASLALRGKPRPVAWLDRVVAPQERAAVWLALAAWIPFLLVVVYYTARSTFPVTVRWLYYGFEDKRWITTTYLLGAIGPMVCLTLAARVLTVGRGHPATLRAWLAGLLPRDSAAAAKKAGPAHAAVANHGRTGLWRRRARRILPVAAGLATALGLAWYFLGPPWYLSQNESMVTAQEDIWLTGFAAIAHGSVPYTGPAGFQYGPGTQALTYLIMRHVTSFSVVGFREAWAMCQWAGASILLAVFFLAFGYARGLAISLLSTLVYPALRQVSFQPGGLFGGYVGWANPLRYAGMVALIALLPAAVRRCPSRRGVAAAAVLGVLWGFTSYLAQENLIAGAVGALVMGALLLFSGTSSWRAARTALVAVLAGFLLIWLPVLAFYALHDDLGNFLHLYFLLSLAMSRGFGNIPWQGGTSMPFSIATMFYALPFLLALIALLTVFEVRPVRIAVGWSRERVRLAATVIIVILLFQGPLLRSAPTDMTGTVLMVPALVVVTATVLPRLLGARRLVTVTTAGAALAAASLMLLPGPLFTWASVRTAAEAPYLDRQSLAAGPRPDTPRTLAAQRIGSGLDTAPQCCPGPPVTMKRLISLMNHIHALIGSRPAYVAEFADAYPGFVYFVADLTPAPVTADKYNTIFNEPQLRSYMAQFRTNVLPHTQALVSGAVTTPEARMFLQRYPSARRILLHYGRRPYWVLLARP